MIAWYPRHEYLGPHGGEIESRGYQGMCERKGATEGCLQQHGCANGWRNRCNVVMTCIERVGVLVDLPMVN